MKDDRLEACRPGQAGCLTSDAPLTGRFCFARIRLEGRALSGQPGYRPRAGRYTGPGPHPSDRPQASRGRERTSIRLIQNALSEKIGRAFLFPD